MLLHKKNIFGPEEYLALERKADIKSEYFDGEIFAMAGASREHNQIASNIVRVLGNDLLEKPCAVFSGDMKVLISKIKKYTYPDIIVVCKDEKYEDENKDVLLNPPVIIEILSDSTEAYDRGDKFFHYQLIDSFSEYILVSQYFCKVEKFSRQADQTWIYSKYINMEDILSIESIECKIPLSEIYRKVNLRGYRLRVY